MGSNLHFFVFAICIFACFSAPVPYAESLRRLEALKTKLSELENTLEAFDNELKRKTLDGDLMGRDMSAADLALLDKHKSMQDVIQAELAKGSHTDADEDAALPDSDEEEKRGMDAYRQLSPEQQALIDKHPSMKEAIYAALNREGHSDAEEDQEIPEEEQPEERRQIDLAAVQEKFKNLSPEDKAILEKFKSKLSTIADVLDKPHPVAEDEDEEIEDDEEDEADEEEAGEEVLRRGNGNVFTYMSQLPEQDQDLLRRMRSKIPNLQLALDRKARHHDENEHDEVEIAESSSASAESPTMFRRGNSNVFTYMNQLSEADQQLLKRMRSKIPYLQLALDKKSKRNNQAYKREEEEESLVSDSEEDDKLSQFEHTLSPDDLALLKAMKSKLHFLKEALHNKKPAADDEEEELETGDEPDSESGPLEERKEAKMDGWNEQPIAEDNLGKEESDLQERCPCQQHEGSEKRCACNKQFEERCPRCNEHDAIVRLLEERCPTCHKDKTPDVVVEEVQTRLMNDIEFARTNGVSVAELIERIKTQAAKRVLNEEEELEMLATA